MTPRPLTLWLAALSATVLAAVSCVNVDPETGEVIPRGNQRYEFEEVERNAEKLEEGMSKFQVLMLLGSPAEESTRGDVWVYLPERPAVIIPANALRLQFRNGRLADHAYHPIVLGQRF